MQGNVASGKPAALIAVTLAAVIALVNLVMSCDGGDSGSTVDVTLTEWAVTASAAEATPGEVTFEATNSGSVTHRLVVVKSDLPPGELPVGETGIDASEVNITGELEALAPGATTELTLQLTPGKYVLLCDVVEAGESHYRNGMYASLLVETES